jgi:hypothetical protein
LERHVSIADTAQDLAITYSTGGLHRDFLSHFEPVFLVSFHGTQRLESNPPIETSGHDGILDSGRLDELMTEAMPRNASNVKHLFDFVCHSDSPLGWWFEQIRFQI